MADDDIKLMRDCAKELRFWTQCEDAYNMADDLDLLADRLEREKDDGR